MLSALPIKDSDFDAMQELISSLAKENIVRWELDQEWIDNVLLPKKEEWKKAWAAYADPDTRTPLITLIKSIARKEYELLFVSFVSELETNESISSKEKISMGIVNAYRKSRLLPTPVEPPGFLIGNSIARCLAFYVFRTKEPTHVRAGGVRGVDVLWAVLDNPPNCMEDLTYSDFYTQSSFVFYFDESERGKTFYFCFRWRGVLEENSPWSKILSCIIP
jgi:hypothetical protein